MAKYIYPAIFTPEEDGGYSVSFPDMENCFTDGNDLMEAMQMANDALCLMLYHKEMKGESIPKASDARDVQKLAGDGEFVSLIACDTMAYRKFYENKAVKKTLSIPSWLNEMAEQAGLNFSATLQEALKLKLNIDC